MHLNPSQIKTIICGSDGCRTILTVNVEPMELYFGILFENRGVETWVWKCQKGKHFGISRTIFEISSKFRLSRNLCES